MIKSRIVKSMLLVVFIGVLAISLVEPISGNDMGQGNMMEQGDTMNNSTENQTHMMHCMMMGVHADNGTMMHCMMGEHSANGTMMSCMIGEQSANGTMMSCMLDQNASTSQAGPDCARFWLQKAILLHDLHMMDPKAAANESSQIELMDQMKQAYECVSEKNITENTTIGTMNQNVSTSQTGSDCASLRLKKAIEIHNLHLSNSTAAANESSQMEMMNQMIQAYDCIPVNNTTIGMCQNASISQARIHCAEFWLQKATEMHEVHLKDPGNRSVQMEIMGYMMRAYDCIKGERLENQRII